MRIFWESICKSALSVRGKSTVVLSRNLEYAIQANVQTTAARCIKSVPEDALRAAQKIDALFAAETVTN